MPELIHGKMTIIEPTRAGRVVVSSKTKPKSFFVSRNGQIRLLLLKLLITQHYVRDRSVASSGQEPAVLDSCPCKK